MSYTIYRFNKLIVPNAEPTQDIGTGDVTIPILEMPRGGAYDAYGSEQIPRTSTTISVQGTLIGKTELDFVDKYNSMRAFLGQKGKLYRKDDAGKVQWAWARLKSIKATRKNINILTIPLTFNFLIYSSVWNGDSYGSWRLDTGEFIDDGLTLEDSLIFHLTPSITSFSLTNHGNAIQRTLQMYITQLSAAGGQVMGTNRGFEDGTAEEWTPWSGATWQNILGVACPGSTRSMRGRVQLRSLHYDWRSYLESDYFTVDPIKTYICSGWAKIALVEAVGYAIYVSAEIRVDWYLDATLLRQDTLTRIDVPFTMTPTESIWQYGVAEYDPPATANKVKFTCEIYGTDGGIVGHYGSGAFQGWFDSFSIIEIESTYTNIDIIKAEQTDLTWQSETDLGVGSELVIDTAHQSIKIDGADSYEGLTINAGHIIDDWMRIDPGENTFDVTMHNVTAHDVEVFYYDAWI